MVKSIVEAIQKAEAQTSAEIRVHLQHFCLGDALKKAKKQFYKLKMQRTRHRNAVLIFVALKSRRFAIYGDEGIHRQAGDVFWGETRDKIASYFSKGQIKEGIIAGIHSAGEKLAGYFPAGPHHPNELPDTVTED